MKKHFFFLLIFSLLHCTLLQQSVKIKPLEFDYQTISQTYFGKNEKPFPLTVQSGINFQASTTEDGRFLVYTSDKESNYDIYLRDLKTSVSIPITNHPAAEYKPSISPNGKYLAFVSEELDSEGDIVLVEFDPKKWIERHLQGKTNELEEEIFITNLEHKKLSKRDRFQDKDPSFSGDSKKIVFSSERFSPGKLNLVIYELDTGKMYPITTEGGVSPCFSKTGEEVFYISNKDHPYGEIYALNLKTKQERRITHDEYLDFSVSVSSNTKEIYYISVRKDTNANNVLDFHDNSFIVKLNLETKKEYLLSSGLESIQEVHYSNFNGGSLLHSLSLYNSVNIFFIPEIGAIPKKENIEAQFEQARYIQKEYSREYFLLSLDAIRQFFETHKLFPIYNAKILDLNLEDLFLRKNNRELQSLLKNQKFNKEIYFGKFIEAAIYEKWKNLNNQAKQILEYQKLLAQIPKNTLEYKEELCSVLELLANSLWEAKQNSSAIQTYNQILETCPNYHNKEKIYFSLAQLSYTNLDQIPETVFQILNNPTTQLSTRRELLNFLEEKFATFSPSTARKNLEELRSKFGNNSSLLSDRFNYSIARTYYQEKNYNKAIEVLDSFLKPLPVQDPECWNKPGCKLIEVCENDPTCLKSHLLKSKCFEELGEKEKSFAELKVALENYNPALGVEIPESEIEKTFRYFENMALTYYSLGRTREAAFNFFYNTENIYLLKEKNLHVDTLYRKYAVYYYQKTVDTVLELALKEAKEARESFLNRINILSKDKLDLFGWISSVLNLASKTRITKNLKVLGDFKDLDRQLILGENATKLMENIHFKSARPRARKVLYLAALYGYAYYLVNKAYILDTFHKENETMTAARKEEILELFKTAEYELKWIIYADPQYYEAYQLLGWLYQYVDVTRYQKISDSEDTENDLYSDIYNKFFTKKHLEENISLYEQILVFLGDFQNKKVLSDLHLNLANNYMLLNNYNRALENFEKVENLHRYVNSETQFETSKQKVLYEYNYARTLLYQNRFEEAVTHFKKALSILEKEESFIQSNLQSEKESFYYKKALLNALIALSYLEAGKFKEAIFHIEQTIALNYTGNYFNSAPLFNYLSYSYLKDNNIEKSKQYLEIAKREYQNRRQFKLSIMEPLWNFILPEKIRIIGESRFPGALPWEFNYLFSLGIETEIYEKEGNFEKVYELFEERKKFIYKHDLEKTSMGEKILLSQTAHLGYFEYFRGNLANSKEHYEKAYKQAETWTEKWKLQLRSTLALLNSSTLKSEEDYNRELNSIVKFEEDFLKDCINKEEKSLQETKLQECKEKLISEFKEYERLKILLHYKISQTFKGKSWSLYLYHLGIALEYLKKVGNISEDLHFLKQDPLDRIQRLELKLVEAQIYLELRESSAFEKLEREITFILSQLKLKEEDVYWKVLLGMRTRLEAKTKRDMLNIERYYEKLLDSILNDPYLVYTLPLNWIQLQLDELEGIYKTTRSYKKIFYLREIYQSIVLFRNFFHYSLEFEDTTYNQSFQSLKQELSTYFKLNTEYRELVQRRENPEKLIGKLKQAQEIIWKKIQKFQKEFALRSSFLDWSKKFSISLKPNQAIVKILSLDSKLVCLIEDNKTTLVKEYNTLDVFRNDLSFWTLDNKEEIYLILDHKFSFEYIAELSFLFRQSLAQKLKKIAFRTTHLELIPAQFKPSLENLRFVDEETVKLENLIYNTDVLVGEVKGQNEKNILGEEKKGSLNLRELLLKEQNISTVIVKVNLRNLWMTYETLAISKIPIVIFAEELPKKDFSIQTLLKDNQKQFLKIGYILTETSSKFSIQDFENHIVKTLELEHIQEYPQAIREINLAFSNLSLNSKDEHTLKADFIDARIKTKLYKNVAGFFFDQILKKYSENDLFSLKILENVLKFCYSYKPFDCEPYYKSYYKQALNPKIDLKTRQRSFFTLKHYRYLAVGKYTQINKNFFIELESSEFEDEFLFYRDLVALLEHHFYYEEANSFAKKLIKIAKQEKEKQIANEIFSNLQVLIHLSSFGPKEELTAKNIYTSMIQKNWKEFFSYLKQIQVEASESILNVYRVKLIEIWKKLEIGEDYDLSSLRPDKTISGKSIFYYLDDKDKLLVFYILSKSLYLSSTEEVSSIVNELVSQESNTNPNLAAYLNLLYMEALFTRPDFANLEKYIKLFESQYKNKIVFEDWLDRFEFLKYKYSLFTNKPLQYGENAKKVDYFVYYEKFKNLEFAEYYSSFFEMLVNKRKETFNSRNKRELNDFLYFLQKLSFEKGKTELFLDLVFFRDRMNSINERFYKKTFRLNEIGTILPIANKLIQKLPKNQRLEFVVNLGLQTFNIKCSQTCTGDEIFSDNRILRDRIYNYYRNLQITGEALLEKESLEKSLRDLIQFDKTKKTYLYLSGFWIKIPLELKENDNIYLIQSPEQLLENPLLNEKNLFQKDVSIKKYFFNNKQNNSLWNLLEETELSFTKQIKNLNLIQEELLFKDLDQILLGKTPLSKLNSKNKKVGVWILYNSGLYETSFLKDDINHALYLLGFQYSGMGVFSLGPQIKQKANLAFTKEFLKEYEFYLNPRKRFGNALNFTKTHFRELEWTGYRLYTNCFLVDE